MLVECNQIEKKYMNKTAVNRVSIQLNAGNIYAILGPNGSGKTTIMKMIAGLIKPTSGEVSFEGHKIGPYSKSKVAYMSTEPWYYSYMTVQDVGKYYDDFFEDFDPARYASLVERMELRMKDKAKNLSSGLAAKLKIAATLARDAKLYMLDEPLNGIDIIARELIINTILEVVGPDKCILMSSHLVDELEKIIDHAIFIKDGNLVLQGNAEDIRLDHGKSIVELYKDIYR